MRKEELATGEYYHIFNRGVDKREVFLCDEDYLRFLETVRFVNDKKTYLGLSEYKRKENRPLGSAVADPKGQQLADIICYCLNPNHFHFILKQKVNNGISLFMGKLSNSYTKYFNTKYDRSGSLFQGPIKSIRINSNEYLLYLSAYVNANYFIHGYEQTSRVCNNRTLGSSEWPYSSFPDYLKKRNGTLVKKEAVLGQFKDIGEYAKFLKENAKYLKQKKEMEKYVLE